MLWLIKSPEPSGESEAAGVADTTARAVDPLCDLARDAASGNAQAQGTLLVAVGPALLRVIRDVLGGSQAEAEDTLQEAMVAVHMALRGFRGECTTLHFACRIAVRTAMNARRSAHYRARHTPSRPPEELGQYRSDAESCPKLRRRAPHQCALRRRSHQRQARRPQRASPAG